MTQVCKKGYGTNIEIAVGREPKWGFKETIMYKNKNLKKDRVLP